MPYGENEKLLRIMSTDYFIYIGPFIKVHNPIQSLTKKIRGCPVHKKEIYHKEQNFCDKCGEPIKLIDIRYNGRNRFDICENFKEERLSEWFGEYKPDGMSDYQFFVPNVGKIGICFNAKDSVNVLEIQSNEPTEKVLAFDLEFRDEIVILREIFSDKKVILCFGVLC